MTTTDPAESVIALERRFAGQIRRARSLVEQSVALYAADGGRGAPTTSHMDVLRAAVILLHASLEDLARSTEETFLPILGSSEILDAVGYPLENRKVAEKIPLGTLWAFFREATVEQVVAAAVRQRCERTSYNDVPQFVRAFRDSGIDVDFSRRLGPVAALMARRHQIAHRSDWVQYDEQGRGRVRTLRRNLVERWIDAVETAGGVALAALNQTLEELNDADAP